MPVVSVGGQGQGHSVHVINVSMSSSFPALTPPEWDPSFHGSVHTATLAVCTVLVIFVVILGTFGNGLVLLSALQCHRLRSNFDVLLFNLAGADFIICSCLSPAFLYLLFSNPPSPREFCGGFLFASTTCGLLSLLTLVAIAAHRQSRVRGRVKGALSTARTACILSVIYAISLGAAVGGTLHVTLSWVETYKTCQAVMNSNDITKNNVVLFFISPIIVVSFVVIVVSYGVIARAVRIQTYLRVKALQPLLRQAVYRPVQCSVPAGRTAAALDMQQVLVVSPTSSKIPKKSEPLKHCTCCSCMTALDKENKAVTMCLVVVLIIALCWTPLVTSHFMELITGESIILYQVKLCGIALVFLNSALNPYMYAQNSGRMKARYGRFLWDVLRCECRMPQRQKFRTLGPKSVGGRSSKRQVINPDCATLQFLQPKPSRTPVFQKCADYNVNNKNTKEQKLKLTQRMYTTNILMFQDGRLTTSLDTRRTEVRASKKGHAQTGVMSDVRTLVHKTCCHGDSPDDQSLIES